jgi:lipopolysaccharide cholinephosphotransferase
MRKVGDEQMKEIQLNILSEIDTICTENGFRYSLAFGTLLGAVRHKGFIPWDDDIDIAMPRKDYDRFIEYCKAHETPFRLVSNETDKRYIYLFAKACAKNTIVEENVGNRYGCELGVYVDIFPVDGLGDTEKGAQKAFEKQRFNRELLVAANWKKFSRSKSRSWVYEPVRFAFYLFSRFVNPAKRIEKIEKYYRNIPFDTAKYAGIMCGAYRAKEIMEQDIFAETVALPFENRSFQAFKEYDRYLTHLYGDYMTPPPKEKQVTHHDFTAYYKDEE